MSIEAIGDDRRRRRRRFWKIFLICAALVVFDQVLAQLAHQRAWERAQNWQDEPRIAEHIYAIEDDEDARMHCVKYWQYIYQWKVCIRDQIDTEDFSLAIHYFKPYAYTNIWVQFIRLTVGDSFGALASTDGAFSIYKNESDYYNENARII